MKKAGQIILLVITIILGVSVLGSFISLLASGFLEVLGITFTLGGNLIINNLLPTGGTNDEEVKTMMNIITAITSIYALIIFGVAFALSLISVALNTALVIVCAIATSRAFKAKNKNQVIFPAVVSFILAALSFINGGNILFVAIYALPGIFFMCLTDKDFRSEEAKTSEPKQEEKIEQVEAETVA